MIPTRPLPPDAMLAGNGASFVPDPACEAWIRSTFIDGTGALVNEEHVHLQSAHLGVLWTDVPNSRHMNTVAAQAEMPFFQGGPWSKARQREQMQGWFGTVPDFVLTFSAEYAQECSDATWCALVEHELLHCGQARTEYGSPRFNRFGQPIFAMRGHDVEEFASVVRRYGVGAAAGRTAELVAVAVQPPEIAAADIAACCGTCGR